MATLNRIAGESPPTKGPPARGSTPLAQLERSVMSCLLWEDEFYEDGQTIGQRIADLVKQVPAADVARVAVRAKVDMRLRHIPLLLARELLRTEGGPGGVRRGSPRRCSRAGRRRRVPRALLEGQQGRAARQAGQAAPRRGVPPVRRVPARQVQRRPEGGQAPRRDPHHPAEAEGRRPRPSCGGSS